MVLDQIRNLLAQEPTLTKADLARRLGVSRATLGYYWRHLSTDSQETSRTLQAPAITHSILVERVAHAADDVRLVIADLRAGPATPANAASVFKGYGALEPLWRLFGELMGDVSPGGNVYLTKVEAMLSAPIRDRDLSPGLQAALQVAQADGSSR